MASHKNALAQCDTCGFEYPYRVMKLNSYGMLVCPTDYDGMYDLKNHPQNKTPFLRDDEFIKNPRPPLYAERNKEWNTANINYEDVNTDWNLI